MRLPEIVSMQELESANNSPELFIKNGILSLELRKLGYNYHYLGVQEQDNPVALTTGFISKYPLKNSSIKFNTSVLEFKNFSGRDKKTAHYTTRDIQFATLKLGSNRLLLFNNHWRSQGCGSLSSCEFSLQVRIANAKLLLRKIEEQIKHSPLTDIIMLGDFNCDYTDRPLKVFGNLGNESLTQTKNRDYNFYNLWYDTQKDNRWTYIFRGKKEALDNIIISKALNEKKAIYYKHSSISSFKPAYLLKGKRI